MAFGDNRRLIRWDGRSKEIFQNNPNIAPPGSEGGKNLEWIAYFKGRRGYNTQVGDRWVWNMSWRCKPGQMFFTRSEEVDAAKHGRGFVVVEPNIESWKANVVSNKDWGFQKYQRVVDLLREEGHEIVQFRYDKGGPILAGVRTIQTKSFRHALSVMANAKMYIGPEGGLHHGAAALELPAAIVIFGDWIPPMTMGYSNHDNFTGKSNVYCGTQKPCPHCKAAMDSITVEAVLERAKRNLDDIVEEEYHGQDASVLRVPSPA